MWGPGKKEGDEPPRPPATVPPVGMSPEVKQAVEKYTSSDPYGDTDKEVRVEALKSLVGFLNAGKVQLLDIVVHLEPALNDASNPTGRRLAIGLLSEALKDPAADLKLNFKYVETFVAFFCSKLVDWQCVEGGVTGLHALLTRHAPQLRTLKDKNDDPIVTDIARQLFTKVHTPSHTQHVRKCILDFARLLVDQWMNEVSLLEGALGEGVLAVIEEERDPRNLLCAFSLAGRLLRESAPEHVSDETLESFFESLTSYFPITFTPPKDDKYGITGDDLKAALAGALAATPRMAKHVVPFMLDSSKDISAGENDSAIRDALKMLGVCLEAYGPEVARGHLKTTLATARDQVCRTTTPAPDEFARAVRRALAASFVGVPVGLTPPWAAVEVDPTLRELAKDACKGTSGSMACDGSKRLLVAAAEAQPMLLQQVWAMTVPALLGEEGSAPKALPMDSLSYVLELCKAAEARKPCPISGKKLKDTLAGAVGALVALEPSPAGGQAAAGGGEEKDTPEKALSTASELVSLLCRLVGEDNSVNAFAAMLALLAAPAAADHSEWSSRWRAELLSIAAAARAPPPGGPPLAGTPAAVLSAILGVASVQAGRASELGAVLLEIKAPTAGAQAPTPTWMAAALPQALTSTALSLAGRATSSSAPPQPAPKAAPASGGKASAPPPPPLEPAAAGELAEKLLRRAVDLLFGQGPAASPEVLRVIADVLEPCAADAAATGGGAKGAGVGEAEAVRRRWVAARLVSLLELPKELARLCGGLGEVDCETGPAPLRRLFVALCASLSEEVAFPLRKAALDAAVAVKADAGAGGALALVPAALQGAPLSDWKFAQPLLQTACRCASSSGATPRLAAAAAASGAAPPSAGSLEALALEALEAVLVTSPRAQVEPLLRNFRESFEPVLRAGGGARTPSSDPTAAAAARGAARCWAAAGGALLRRGGCSPEAEGFLKVLLSALSTEGAPVAPYVPVAFQVMMPPCFSQGGTDIPEAKLPPLALQQLSRTVLPQLMTTAKAAAAAADAGTCAPGSAGRAALESAVALLAAVPPEVSCVDCKEDMRWCTLTGLKYLKEDSAGAGVFAAQVLQLLVRAARRHTPWIEDDLSTIVQPLVGAAVSHPVPLVRLGALQALQMLTEQSQGHMLGLKKPIEQCLKRAVEDRRREVRLVAAACLNTWHCGLTIDRSGD